MSRNGRDFGHFHARMIPAPYNGASFDIESYVNPTGSRNLEFDPTRQPE
jgi:hypothetical protein